LFPNFIRRIPLISQPLPAAELSGAERSCLTLLATWHALGRHVVTEPERVMRALGMDVTGYEALMGRMEAGGFIGRVRHGEGRRYAEFTITEAARRVPRAPRTETAGKESAAPPATGTARALRVAVADDEEDTRRFLCEVAEKLGHEVVAAACTGAELVKRCRTARPDLIIADVRMPDMSGLEAASALNRERAVPVVLVTGYDDDFLAGGGVEHVMAYLSKPIRPADLLAAIKLASLRFEQLQRTSQEAATLRQSLEDRKQIERAKGIVMKRLRVDEEDSFRRLRKFASDQNQKLVDVARRVSEADDVFHEMERL
jgi:response regulator NasT